MSLSNTTTIKVNWDLELRKATLKGKVNEIHLAIEKGANIHRSLKGKWTYLHLAARNKQAAALKTLIECGANINAKKDDGATSLHVACSAGYLSITKVLVDNNIDIRARNKHGDTALHLAANFGHIDLVTYLMETNSSIIFRNNYGSTPIHLAAANGHVKVVSALLNYYNNNNNNNNNNNDDDTTNNNNNNNKNVINALTVKGNTPLHMAYFFDKKKVIDFLIHSGADTTILNKDGLAPSQVTRFKKRKKSIVKYHNLAKRTRSTMLRRRDELPCLTDTSSSSSSSSTSSPSASPLSPMRSSSSVLNNIRKQERPMVEKDDNIANLSRTPQQTKKWKKYAKYLKTIIKNNNLSADSFQQFQENGTIVVVGPESPLVTHSQENQNAENNIEITAQQRSPFRRSLSPLKNRSPIKITRSPVKNNGRSPIRKMFSPVKSRLSPEKANRFRDILNENNSPINNYSTIDERCV